MEEWLRWGSFAYGSGLLIVYRTWQDGAMLGSGNVAAVLAEQHYTSR